jgi:ParB family chromosome partitioning protein
MHQIVQQNLSVRDTENLIQKLKHKPQRKKVRSFDPDLEALQEELIKQLGTKVSFSGSQRKGVIKIYYFSLDELNRIYEQIKGASL